VSSELVAKAKVQPVATIDEQQLRAAGFTESGLRHFGETVRDYAAELMQKAVHLGEADKAPAMLAEVTHEHVRASAHSIARSYGTPPRRKWLVVSQVGEYVSTAIAGVGGGHLEKQGGILAFALGVSVAVILVVVRLTHAKVE
jgi:hypothetical protein